LVISEIASIASNSEARLDIVRAGTKIMSKAVSKLQKSINQTEPTL
jgi:hypothetical protein